MFEYVNQFSVCFPLTLVPLKQKHASHVIQRRRRRRLAAACCSFAATAAVTHGWHVKCQLQISIESTRSVTFVAPLYLSPPLSLSHSQQQQRQQAQPWAKSSTQRTNSTFCTRNGSTSTGGSREMWLVAACVCLTRPSPSTAAPSRCRTSKASP